MRRVSPALPAAIASAAINRGDAVRPFFKEARNLYFHADLT